MNNDYTMLTSSRPNKLLKKIKKKAQMQADMHGQLADYNLKWQNFLLYGTLFTSVLMLSLTFVSDEFIVRTTPLTADYFMWLRALIAVGNFFAGLVLTIWRPSDHEAKHREAIRHYTRVLYEIRHLEERDDISEEDVKVIQSLYLNDSSVPPIPDKYFLKLKKRYLVKVAISKYLEEHPYAWIWWVKVRLWFQELWSGSLHADVEHSKKMSG
ncbi:hypothetical protein [Neomoorella thermoacetica]|uniref:hypothetical protein n=1 Tax=Neomoorella thermoacetica TaxID=1525 RepID=UPI0008FA8AA6|nr:hypothetical protein [Moorella thermoacetica]OIQ10577.1 hypothetical protein MOOTH_25470 [Moorella thermoacetica]